MEITRIISTGYPLSVLDRGTGQDRASPSAGGVPIGAVPDGGVRRFT
jgi:hypothetical protein